MKPRKETSRRILLIDDNEEAMGHLADAIRVRGGDVVQVASRRQAREAAKGRFDGIIVDLMFAPADDIPARESDSGFRGGAFIFEHDVRHLQPATPFVILTAVDKTTAVYRAGVEQLQQHKGFRGALEKPATLGEILRLLHTEQGSGKRRG